MCTDHRMDKIIMHTPIKNIQQIIVGVQKKWMYGYTTLRTVTDNNGKIITQISALCIRKFVASLIVYK